MKKDKYTKTLAKVCAARNRREREIATIDLKKEFEFHLQFQTCKSLKKLLPRGKVL